ncbi:unnamed protein product [Plutella xylostella]|uniref:(diamondback moth) hypothetical protein n=1 Tax=Plutella xylostella TaxID=51655 RepID=A0A8S4FJB9_PLUXY|nr:unnamed protein product [Plutella xylostella]
MESQTSLKSTSKLNKSPSITNTCSISKLSSKTSLSRRLSCESRSSVDISCRICLSTVLDAAELACGHQFCEQCLNTYWQKWQKPGYIVCPLCRTFVFDIEFAKKGTRPSTKDFRSVFDPTPEVPEKKGSNTLVLCLKLSFFILPIYYLATWINDLYIVNNAESIIVPTEAL